MKYINIFSIILATSLFTAGCSKEQEGSIYRPGTDDAKEIHFIQSSLTKEFPQGSKSGTLEIEIARPDNKGELSVSLRKEERTKVHSAFPKPSLCPTAVMRSQFPWKST